MSNTNIDLERNYEFKESGKVKKQDEKQKGERIKIGDEEDENEPLAGLSGTRW